MTSLTVWFDGGCPLCRREIAAMRRLDRRGAIDFVDVSTSSDRPIERQSADTCPIDRDALLARFHAREDGRMLSGAAAFAAMWRAIPMLGPLGQIARIPIILAGLERAYRMFLRVRPSLQSVARKLDRPA